MLVSGSSVDVMRHHAHNTPPLLGSVVVAAAGRSTGYHREVSARSLGGDTKQGV